MVENFKYDKRKCKWWKIGVFSLDFWLKIRWILSLFSTAENHIFFGDAAGLTGLVLSILSVLSASDSTNYKQFLL